MRREFAIVMAEELRSNENSVLILGDIGVFGHRDSFIRYPDRVFNVGILEQSMVSLAAGMALAELTPTVHTIAPFLVERAFEQIKIDFGYQSLGGNFITVGASIDYAALGATHHCPGDVGLMLNIPGAEIFVPGTAEEFSTQYAQACQNGNLSYFRLSEQVNRFTVKMQHQKGALIKKGKHLTIVAVGPMLNLVLEATSNLDVSVLYYNCISPFDSELLCSNLESGKLLIVEPYYVDTTIVVIQDSISDRAVMIRSKGMPRKFVTKYGMRDEHYQEFGLTPIQIRRDIQEMISE